MTRTRAPDWWIAMTLLHHAKRTLAIGCILVEAVCVCAFAQSYMVEGSLEFRVMDFQGQIWHTQHMSFQVNVEDDLWFVTARFLEYPDAWEEAYYDGQDVLVLKFDEGAKEGQNQFAFVHRLGVPGVAYNLDIPWLAYASAQRLSQGQNVLPAPWEGRGTVGVHLFTLNVVKSANPPYLPQKIEFLYSKERAKAVADNPSSVGISWPPQEVRREISSFDQRFDDGATAAEYEVISWETNRGLHIPQEFTFKMYSDSSKTLAAEHFGKLNSSVSPSTPVTFPECPEGAVITVGDERWRDPNSGAVGLLYFATNEYFRSMTDPQLIAGFQQRVREIAARDSLPRDNRNLLIAFLALQITVALTWVFVSFRRMRRTEKSK